MKQLLPGAMFIGFTGTPLLKADKATSIETFGSFIHTYKFDEAVADGVVLDLRYEARNIDQDLTSPDKVDKWFEAKTKGMTDLSRAELKKRWGTMQKVVSAEPRARQIVNDILLDMETKPRLMEVGQRHARRRRASTRPASSTSCSVRPASRASAPSSPATSHSAGDISKEDSGEGATERLRQYEIYRQMLADHFDEPADIGDEQGRGVREGGQGEVRQRARPDAAADRRRQAADRLRRTAAPPTSTSTRRCRTTACSRRSAASTGSMATTRTTATSSTTATCSTRSRPRSPTTPAARWTATRRRTSRACCPTGSTRPARTWTRRWRRIRALCEPVAPPKNTLQYQQYFCATEQGNAEQLKANEPKRVELYKAVAAVVRAYGNLANEMDGGGLQRRRGRGHQGRRSRTTRTCATR